MVQISKLIPTVAASFFVASTLAHPGHSVDDEVAERSAYLKYGKRDVSHCAESLRKRGHEQRAVERRQATIENLRAERKLKSKRTLSARDAASVVATNHHSSLNVTEDSRGGLFGVDDIIYSNSSCTLTPEGEIGPYWVEGEYIRSDIRESQPGVDIIVDGQFIDVDTCEPVPAIYWDLWHCNSTGVYGGVIGSGNGNEDDATNINNTFLRGIQPSNADGVAQFKTVFPGHYDGRATHIHIVAHYGGEVLANGTYSGGNVTHIGQTFFDQDLITEINALEPYSQNTVDIVENIDDRVFAVMTADGADPVYNYVLLGDDVTDGLFMWLTLGIDLSESYATSAASRLTSSGGVAESNSGGGVGGGSAPSGGGSAPSGGAPSGTASSVASAYTA